MTMSSGTRLGPYEIVAPIGAGGMGEVYKARDTRLDRAVAVKILSAELAQNAQFKIRFEREAKAISQLSHPHICALYDVGENYLVMELLDGETLADRLARGPLPLQDVLKYGTQIAEALGKAHREGIIHRDLKPGNIMITKSGAKLLDFGLAKSAAPPASAAPDATEQRPLTAEGYVLGTVQYMSPEQIAGEEADARTDIFALGVVLYEMATGRRAFEGKTRTSIVASIMSGEPRRISELQPLTPPALEHIVDKCLPKDRDERWQNALDVAEELRWIGQGQSVKHVTRAGASGPLIVVAIALVAGAAIAAYLMSRSAPPKELVYSEINAPQGVIYDFDASAPLLSPDGRKIAFVAKPVDGPPLLWVRALDSPAPRALKGTENAAFPFWSPDSKSLAFFAERKIKRIDANGGSAETITNAASSRGDGEVAIPRGGSWGKDNIIIFAMNALGPLFRVAATGGEPQQLTSLDIEQGHTSHRFPAFLPDGRHFLAFVQGVVDGNNILLGSLDSKDTRMILRADAGVTFAPPDIVLFVRGGTLRAQRMDMKTFALIGDALSVADGIRASSTIDYAAVSASNDAALAYVSGAAATLSILKLVDAAGKEVGTIGTPSDLLDPRMAPDGHAIAMTGFDSNGIGHIWSIDLRRNIANRITDFPAAAWTPVWSPDSKSIVYTSFDGRPGDLLLRAEVGNGPGELLLGDKRRKIATDWSADGRYIIYHTLVPGRGRVIEALSMPDRKIIPLVQGPASGLNGHLSRDGRWLAYTSDVSGAAEIFVQHFPDATANYQISGGGGTMPLWSRDGHQLYFWQGGTLMAAAVHTERGFVADAPRVVFGPSRMRFFAGLTRNQYDLTPDGGFVINANATDTQSATITLVQNWKQALARRQ